MWRHIVTLSILFSVVVCLVIGQQASNSIESVLELKSRINRLAVSVNTNKPSQPEVELIIAGTNHLYKVLDPLQGPPNGPLKIDVDLTTGPKLQKQQCAFFTEPHSQCIRYACDAADSTDPSGDVRQLSHKSRKQFQLVDNDNRLLLVDQKSRQLIECGTIDYGGCRLRQLSDLSLIGCNYSAPVIPFNSAGGVVVGSSADPDSALYLMISNEYDPSERLDKTDFPIFSIRQLRPPLFQTKYPIESMNYDQTIFSPDFHMKIIYSFKHNGYVYFLFTITNKMLSESCNRVDATAESAANNQTIVTRMLRICDSKWTSSGGQRFNRDSDPLEQMANMYTGGSATNSATLTETVVDCTDQLTGEKYHLLESAHFLAAPGSAGKSAARDESTLFLTFNSSASSSIVCTASVRDIDSHFVSMLRKCLDGDNTYAELVSPYSNKNTWKTPCRCSVINDFSRKSFSSQTANTADLPNEQRLFCHNDFFNYMNSRRTLGLKSIQMDARLGAVTAVVGLNSNHQFPTRNKVILVLATLDFKLGTTSQSDAQIAMFTYDAMTNKARRYDQFSLGAAGSGPIGLEAVDLVAPNKKLVYATYDRYLYKINLQNCEQYRTCEMCLNGPNQTKMSNPFCGWCMYEQRCTLKGECLRTEANTDGGESAEIDEASLSSLWLTSSAGDSCPAIVGVAPSRYVNPLNLNPNKQDNYVFRLNVKLIPSVDYYCDITANLNQRTSSQTTLSRVPASFLNETSVRCDLMPIKAKFEQMTRSSPIRSKFVNVSLQLRATTTNLYPNKATVAASSQTTTLISSTSLYTFNCSYFRECSQCLSPQLGASCVWCAKNSKCIFASQSRRPNEQASDDCPNEVEFYRRSDSNFSPNSQCTSFNLNNKNKIEIPYSVDSNLAQTSTLVIQNAHRNYQHSFKCVFSRTKSPLSDAGQQKLSASYVEWVPLPNQSTKEETSSPFDCRYAPYNDLNDDRALQTVYLSVWWSPQAASTDPAQLHSLDGWNQLQLYSPNELDDETFLADLRSHSNTDESSGHFIEINVVNCKVKASSCGKCLDEQLISLGCGWCTSSQKCTMENDCPSSSLNWMNGRNSLGAYCPNPQVHEMGPKCGPRQSAGTQLVLEGENLGIRVKDVQVRMSNGRSEGEIECTLVEELYVPSTRIVCRTQPVDTDEPYTVWVRTKPGDDAYSSLNEPQRFTYRYVTPEIVSIEPRRGIKSGGTLVKIRGKHLSCGSELTVKFLVNGAVCRIVNVDTVDRASTYSLLESDGKYEQLDEIHCISPPLVGSASSSTIVQVKMDEYVMNLTRFKFDYVEDPKIHGIEPDSAIVSGGLTMMVKGRGFDSLQTAYLILSSTPMMNVDGVGHFTDTHGVFRSKCSIVNSTVVKCPIPSIKDKRLVDELDSLNYFYYVHFNELSSKLANTNLQTAHSADEQQIRIFPDPTFEPGQIFSDKAPIILIRGENLLRGVRESDYKILIGVNQLECNITSITSSFIACLLPDQEHIDANEKAAQRKRQLTPLPPQLANTYEVRVRIGELFSRSVGLLKYEREMAPLPLNGKYDVIEVKYIIVSACLISFVLLVTMLGCFVILKQRQNKQIRQLKRMQTEFENLEMRVARECKEAFTELQMDIGELANTLNQTGAPFNDFQNYCMKILFPHAPDTDRYYMTTMIDLRMSAANKENVKNGVLMFSQLILNKKFLLTFIHTLEADTHSFLLQDRVNLASYLSIILHDRLDYFTDILMTLLGELIEKLIDTKNNPKILLRRNESIAEKMLTNWFAFLLYDFIRDCAGTPLYILFLSIKQQIYKGPVDAITCEARYSLSEDKLIRQSIDYETLTIRVQLQDLDDVTNEITVKVLNCDTITQVKEKILDTFFKGYPYSKRPNVNELDLIFIPSEWNKNSKLILYDEDKTCKIDNDDYKRLNTLAHYKIPNGALFLLASRQANYHHQLIHSSVNDACNSYSMLDPAKNAENMTLLSKSSKGSSSPPTYSKLSTTGLNDFNNGGVFSAMNGSSIHLTECLFPNPTHNNSSARNQNNPTNATSTAPANQMLSYTNKNPPSNHHHHKYKKYHLIKTNDQLINNTTPSIKDDKSKQEIAAKLVSEVYLTRLLATKGGMQSYVDDFFESVFSTAHGSNVLPFAIKYLFDFLDEQANLHGIADPDVVYTWKSNSLPLRFWVNIIKNPDFVFDIHKSNIVDASLSTIASTFMDSCSQSKLDLNKESPSGKLLFYKEVHKYRKWVESYYSEIRQMPKIDEQDLNEMLNEESKKRFGTFNKNNALYRLYNDYIKKYRVQIENALNDQYQDASRMSVNKHLNYRLQQVIYLMDAIEV